MLSRASIYIVGVMGVMALCNGVMQNAAVRSRRTAEASARRAIRTARLRTMSSAASGGSPPPTVSALSSISPF